MAYAYLDSRVPGLDTALGIVPVQTAEQEELARDRENARQMGLMTGQAYVGPRNPKRALKG